MRVKIQYMLVPGLVLLILGAVLGCQEDPTVHSSEDESQSATQVLKESTTNAETQEIQAQGDQEVTDLENMLDQDLMIRAKELYKQISHTQEEQLANVSEDQWTNYDHNGKNIRVTKTQARKLRELDAITRQLEINAKRRVAEDQDYEKKMELAEHGLDNAEKKMKILQQEEKILEEEHQFQKIMTLELKKAIQEEEARGRFQKVGFVKASEGGEVLITTETEQEIAKGTALLVIRDGKFFTTIVMHHSQQQGIVAKSLPNGKELNEGDQVVMVNPKARKDQTGN